MDNATNELLQYRVLGAFAVLLVAGIIWLAVYIRSLHKEAMKREEKNAGQMAELAREGHIAIKNNTDIVSSVKTLLETTRERKR